MWSSGDKVTNATGSFDIGQTTLEFPRTCIPQLLDGNSLLLAQVPKLLVSEIDFQELLPKAAYHIFLYQTGKENSYRAKSEVLIYAKSQQRSFGGAPECICGKNADAYMVPTQCLNSKKPDLKGRAKCLILLVPTAGFELAT